MSRQVLLPFQYTLFERNITNVFITLSIWHWKWTHFELSMVQRRNRHTHRAALPAMVRCSCFEEDNKPSCFVIVENVKVLPFMIIILFSPNDYENKGKCQLHFGKYVNEFWFIDGVVGQKQQKKWKHQNGNIKCNYCFTQVTMATGINTTPLFEATTLSLMNEIWILSFQNETRIKMNILD